MPQPNDLSRSLVALDQNSTIIAVDIALDVDEEPAVDVVNKVGPNISWCHRTIRTPTAPSLRRSSNSSACH
jgi:hypothetical protein